MLFKGKVVNLFMFFLFPKIKNRFWNFNAILSKLIILVACFSVMAGVTSCKSHKKSKKEDLVIVDDMISVKTKKQKNKEYNALRKQIADESKTWIGTPYGYGHCEKGVATDCSGLVIVVYEQIAKIKLPRNSAEQADFCEDLKEKNIEPGDLVFFATGKDKKKVSHVGVMIDAVKFVHASASKGVIMSEMTTPYYQRTFIKYGRVPNLKE